MAIRIRNYYNQGCEYIESELKAVCAAEEPKMDGDLYLHDGVHDALANKFMADWTSSGLIPPNEVENG